MTTTFGGGSVMGIVLVGMLAGIALRDVVVARQQVVVAERVETAMLS